MTQSLRHRQPFAGGGNRLCFVHPEKYDLCIKVRRPDFTLEDRRRKKGFPKNLKPLSSFDDNLDEFRVMQALERYYPDDIFKHVSRCYGYVNTDMGPGLCSELIRDSDGKISISLKQYLWEQGYTQDCQRAADELVEHWRQYSVPSRDLIVHNIVLQKDISSDGKETIRRMVVIDGMGNAGLIPGHRMPWFIQTKKTQRKIDNFRWRIQELLDDKEAGRGKGYHGFLFHSGNDSSNSA
ncbi:PhoP regulatory network protein YrbL [Spongiibacter sp. IMCC21906]|uniref:YrbL family protein n=1 Tax=Spongiibacter sp. IMCC21906 TaxID=1620392 RepID=UPI00062E079B|nr:YrbL family protein [Spongiibacter sp. IMCC21906]AKH68646.1 PhoP regulatory network protein YrbL [Spongiibacter sp. IMCC21906]